MKPCIILLLTLFLIQTASGAPNSMVSRLDALLDESGIKKTSMALYVADRSNKIIYSHNGEKNMIPASISKILTTAAVLNAFPPGTKFHTQIFTTGTLKNGVLTGDIYLKGLGDPAFVSEKMWMMVSDFSRSGILKITGNIIADDSFFDDQRFDPGRESDRNDRAYDAPIGALSFNWNSTTIQVRPAKSSGEPASVFIDPPNSFVTLSNKAQTSSKGTDLQAERSEVGGHDTVVVRGKIAVGSEEHHIYKDISNPPLYAASNFREFLKARGISVLGEIKTGVVPKSADLVTDFEGEPLYRIVNDMNKFSNNYIAEMLAKNLGAYKTGQQGKMSDGLDEVKRFLTSEMKWKAQDFNLSNVSGFTRKNSFSPKQFVEVLAWFEKHFNVYPEFLESLPIGGVDGTLHKRMKTDAAGWIRAKTGLLNGVVALSGYAASKNGEVKFFTFIYNGSGQEAHVRDVFDGMASLLALE